MLNNNDRVRLEKITNSAKHNQAKLFLLKNYDKFQKLAPEQKEEFQSRVYMNF